MNTGQVRPVDPNVRQTTRTCLGGRLCALSTLFRGHRTEQGGRLCAYMRGRELLAPSRPAPGVDLGRLVGSRTTTGEVRGPKIATNPCDGLRYQGSWCEPLLATSRGGNNPDVQGGDAAFRAGVACGAAGSAPEVEGCRERGEVAFAPPPRARSGRTLCRRHRPGSLVHSIREEALMRPEWMCSQQARGSTTRRGPVE